MENKGKDVAENTFEQIAMQTLKKYKHICQLKEWFKINFQTAEKVEKYLEMIRFHQNMSVVRYSMREICELLGGGEVITSEGYKSGVSRASATYIDFKGRWDITILVNADFEIWIKQIHPFN